MSVALLFPSSFISDPVCESKLALSPQLIVIFIFIFFGLGLDAHLLSRS